MTCSVEGCSRSVRTRGLCNTHYARWYRHGDPGTADLLRGESSAPVRFWRYVAKDGPGGCWVWTGAIVSRYGQFAPTRRERVVAHRFAYELMVGPIPEGLQLDHLCRNTVCVNPDHLEPVTPRENVLRSTAPSAVNAARVLCQRGHDSWVPRPDGSGRRCTECNRLYSQVSKARREARA